MKLLCAMLGIVAILSIASVADAKPHDHHGDDEVPTTEATIEVPVPTTATSPATHERPPRPPRPPRRERPRPAPPLPARHAARAPVTTVTTSPPPKRTPATSRPDGDVSFYPTWPTATSTSTSTSTTTTTFVAVQGATLVADRPVRLTGWDEIIVAMLAVVAIGSLTLAVRLRWR